MPPAQEQSCPTCPLGVGLGTRGVEGWAEQKLRQPPQQVQHTGTSWSLCNWGLYCPLHAQALGAAGPQGLPFSTHMDGREAGRPGRGVSGLGRPSPSQQSPPSTGRRQTRPGALRGHGADVAVTPCPPAGGRGWQADRDKQGEVPSDGVPQAAPLPPAASPCRVGFLRARHSRSTWSQDPGAGPCGPVSRQAQWVPGTYRFPLRRLEYACPRGK